jgi:hypothetical protein
MRTGAAIGEGDGVAKTYLWCSACRRSFDDSDVIDNRCPLCGAEMRRVGWVAAFLRGMMAQELVASGLPTRHRAMIRMVWTANGMGERYYRALSPPVPYSKFEAAVTDMVCRAAADGWVRVVLPASPIGAGDGDYRIEIDDEERFIEEMAALFAAQAESTAARVE